MKKLLLLLVSGAVAFSAGAQERAMSAGSVKSNAPAKTYTKAQIGHTANKTTAGGSRWYNYAFDYVDTTQFLLNGYNVTYSSTYLWQDTSLWFSTSTTPRNVNLVSIAAILDPHAASFNDSTFFEGAMKLTTANAYVVDSVQVAGVYRFNPAKTTVVDTLVLSFVKGNGAASLSDDVFSGYSLAGGGHYGAVTFLDIKYDSVQNYARSGTTFGGVSNDVILRPLTMADWADTNANGIWVKNIAIPTALNVSAGGYAGMSISFRSGDATRPMTPSTFDTIETYDGHAKYNDFEPLISFVYDGTNVQFAPYSATDNNAGYFKELPSAEGGWSETYLPMYAFSSTSSVGAYFYQYPMVDWHVTCASCGVITNTASVSNVSNISKVNAYPNPATSQLNIPFTLSQSANVTVTLSNAVGQVVSTKEMGNVASGTAVMNTSALSAGVYFYTVTANGQRSTGRVAIAK